MSKFEIVKKKKDSKESFVEYKYIINNDLATMYIDAGAEVKNDFLESRAYFNLKYDDNVESFEYDISDYNSDSHDYYFQIGGSIFGKDKVTIDINEGGIYNYGVVNLVNQFKMNEGFYYNLLRKNKYKSFNNVLSYGFNSKGIVSFEGSDVTFEGENGLIIKRDNNLNEFDYPFLSIVTTGFYSKSALVGEFSWEEAKIHFDVKLFHYDKLYRFNNHNCKLENVEFMPNRKELVLKHRQYILQIIIEGDNVNSSVKVTLRDKKGQIIYTGLSRENLIESVFVEEV